PSAAQGACCGERRGLSPMRQWSYAALSTGGRIMDLGLRGQRVVVTGGAAGIGLAIARGFAAEGARVAGCDVDPAALEAMTASDPGIFGARCDVGDRAEVARFMEAATAALGGLDTLVNNAGIAGPTGRVEDIPPEEWDRCVAISLTSQFNFARLG